MTRAYRTQWLSSKSSKGLSAEVQRHRDAREILKMASVGSFSGLLNVALAAVKLYAHKMIDFFKILKQVYAEEEMKC